MKSISLKNNLSFITGASSGIGEATALRLASLGSNLIIAARRKDRLNTLADKIRKEHAVEVTVLKMDVSSVDNIKANLEPLVSKLSKIDILVNNAGLALGRDRYENTELENSLQMIRTNCEGLLTVTRMLTLLIKTADNPNIVNISSVAGDTGYEGGAVYCSTKAFVSMFSEGLRHDFLDTNVRIINIKPGLLETEFSIVRFGGDKSKASAVYAGVEPLVADDVADCIEFAVTRPSHAQVSDISLYATNQASPTTVYRK